MNYGELKSAVKGYLHRSDSETMMPTFLALAEERIYHGEATAPALRASGMVKTVSMTTAARPADFLEAKLIHEDGNPNRVLHYVPLANVNAYGRCYSWDGESIALSDDQSLPVSLTYYARLDPLVADGDTNWLLTKHPNVYLTSMLVDAARWARDDELGAREAANYISAVNSLMAADKTAQYSGSILTMRIGR